MNTITLKIIGILVLAVVGVFMFTNINNSNQITEVESLVPINKTEKAALAPTLISSHQRMSGEQIAQPKQINAIINNKVGGEKSQNMKSSLSIKNNPSNSFNYQKNELNSALSSIPINYHSMFHWQEGYDQGLVEAYMSVTQLNELDDIQNENEDEKINDVNLEELISDFIYQHEYVEQVQIESLNCNHFSCVVYGVELQSGAWNMITEGVKGQQWAEFEQETTRSSVDENGNLTFLTIIKR